MTPRAAYATACGVLAFIGGMLLAGLVAWDLYPGHWDVLWRGLAVTAAVCAALIAVIVAYDNPSKWVRDRERRHRD